jgi:hypothetical protein
MTKYTRKGEIERLLKQWFQKHGHRRGMAYGEKDWWAKALDRFGYKERQAVWREQIDESQERAKAPQELETMCVFCEQRWRHPIPVDMSEIRALALKHDAECEAHPHRQEDRAGLDDLASQLDILTERIDLLRGLPGVDEQYRAWFCEKEE